MGKGESEESKVTIEDFVSQHKVYAFCNTYLPVDNEQEADEVMTDARIRKYFQAFPRNIGDPLNWYLDALSRNGYVLRTSTLGEPALFLRRKNEAHAASRLLDEVFGADNTDSNHHIEA